MATVRLLGERIAYSASPAMHAAAFAALGLDHRYELADVSAAELPRAVAALRNGDVLGANVTVPHKAQVIPLLDEVDALAERAEAVNTIVNRDGLLIGFNTDVPAITDEISRLRPEPATVVVLGAGGAARAVKLAAESVGATGCILVSREISPQLPILVADAELVVNATPVGTNADESPINVMSLTSRVAVLDLVYRPSPTRLVHDARAHGLDARAGAGVLLGQGWRSLEAWLGFSVGAEVKRAMADALSAELGPGADV